jgi:phage FluMu gp28-like protein
MLPQQIFKANESVQSITLANGAVMWFKSGEKPDTLYGEDVFAAVIDEATRLREDAWIAVRSTLTATKGPIRIVSNVKGRRNWAYHMARRAEQGFPDMGFYRITAYEAADGYAELEMANPPITLDDIESAKRDLPAHAFQELYLAEPSDDAANPFGMTAIRECVGLVSEDRPVAWGWDLGKSQDFTVGIALDSQGRVCRLHRWQSSWRATMAEIVQLTGEVPALVDSTGVGDPIFEELVQHSDAYEDYKFTQQSKQQLMEGLAVAFQRKDIRIPDDRVLLSELEAFEYRHTRLSVLYTAPEGLHDDCVCALALAVRKLGLLRTSQAAPAVIFAGDDEPEMDFWTPSL